MRDFFTILVPALTPVIQAIAVAVFGLLSAKTAQYVHNKTLATLLQTLERYCATAVSDVYQSTVSSLKSDPSSWTAQAKLAAKTAAVERVRALAPQVIASLAAAGEDTNSTIGQFIEHAVVELNTRLAPTPATPARPGLARVPPPPPVGL